jgi:hypothetical protein
MAIGAARLFGLQLPINFHSPFQATGIIEFWQRWHMTLSRFLRDYLYIPLGGNRKGAARRYLNLMLTMTIGGLWHGAAWTFVLWGFLHGLYLIVNHAWRTFWPPIDRWWSRAIARLVTTIAVVVAFVTFRAADLDVAARMYGAMIGLQVDSAHALRALRSIERLSLNVAGVTDRSLIVPTTLWAAVALIVLWFVPNTQQLMARFAPAYNYSLPTWLRQPPLLTAWVGLRALPLTWRPGLLAAIAVGIITGVALLSLQHVSEFLYFEF